jgi:uncharacterized membrane protein
MGKEAYDHESIHSSSLWALLKIGIPFTIAALYFLLLYILLPRSDFLRISGIMLAYFVPPSGKETLIPLGIILGLPWWLMAISLSVMDIITCMLIIWNFDLVMKVPYLGRWVGRFMLRGKKIIDERPWIAKYYLLGLIFFIMIPFQGTGGIGGSIIGRMLGLKNSVIILAMAVGTTIESFFIAFGSFYLIHVIEIDPAFILVVIGCFMLGVIALTSYYYARRYQSARRIENHP